MAEQNTEQPADQPDKGLKSRSEVQESSPPGEATYVRVPFIGKKWTRWYDIPYKALWFLQTKWRRKLLPGRGLDLLYRACQQLQQFNDLERHRARAIDSRHDFEVPPDEHVTMPALWVVELFPPSQLSALENAIRKNRWDNQRRLAGLSESNQTMLTESRARAGWQWWHMVSVVRPEARYSTVDSVRQKLPTEFSLIELKAVQIGSGLTAVVAHFHLSDDGSSQLDEAWHRPHEPGIGRVNGVRRAEDRRWSGFRTTQAARARLHTLAKDWMRENCPGLFAEFGKHHTSVDLLLTDQFDPTGQSSERSVVSDRFRALGLIGHDAYRRTSQDLPGLLLVPTVKSLVAAMETSRTWALWGKRDLVLEGMSDWEPFGSDPDRAAANMYSEAIESFLVNLAITDMLRTFEGKHAQIRDRARSQHGRFNAGVISELRGHLLSLSMDISSVQRDLETFWKYRPKFEHEAEFTLESAPQTPEEWRSEPVHLNSQFREHQKEWFEDLAAADREYRDILTTVASLGASVDATKTGRRALGVALVSLTVAVATVMVADIGDNSLLVHVRSWLGLS